MSNYVIIALALIAIVAAAPAENSGSQGGYGNQGAHGNQGHHGLTNQQGAHLNFDGQKGTYGQGTYARPSRAASENSGGQGEYGNQGAHGNQGHHSLTNQQGGHLNFDGQKGTYGQGTYARPARAASGQ